MEKSGRPGKISKMSARTSKISARAPLTKSRTLSTTSTPSDNEEEKWRDLLLLRMKEKVPFARSRLQPDGIAGPKTRAALGCPGPTVGPAKKPPPPPKPYPAQGQGQAQGQG